MESDVVGYSTITIKPGYNLLGVPFNSLNSEEGLSIQEIFSDTTKLVYGDIVQYWNGSKLVYVTYYGEEYGWLEGITAPTVKLMPGTGFWFNSKSTEDREIAISGRVVLGDSSQTVEAQANTLELVSPALPIEYTISDIQFSDSLAPNSLIQYWNGSKLVYITYYGKEYGWLEGITVPTHTFKPGEGFWFLGKGSENVTITFPLLEKTEE